MLTKSLPSIPDTKSGGRTQQEGETGPVACPFMFLKLKTEILGLSKIYSKASR